MMRTIYPIWTLRECAFVDFDRYDVLLAADMSLCMITPTGIEYLSDKSFMQKVKRFLKDVNETNPL